jgi:hypothetical protein
VLWSIFFIISGPQIWGDIGGCEGYGGIQWDTAGYSGIQRDTARYAKNILQSTGLCSRAPRRIGGVGEGFADSNVYTAYPCVGWLVGVYEVGVAIATRNESTQEREGEDAEGGVSSPGLGHEASAGVVLISGDEKTTVFVYEVVPGEGEVVFTCVLSLRVITCRVACSAVSWANAQNGHSSAMWRVVSRMGWPSSRRQRSHAPFFSGSFGFVASATDGKGV